MGLLGGIPVSLALVIDGTPVQKRLFFVLWAAGFGITALFFLVRALLRPTPEALRKKTAIAAQIASERRGGRRPNQPNEGRED